MQTQTKNSMKNALALIIGNIDYREKQHKLDNAVNDANDFAAKLMTLGFTVQKVTDCDRESFERAVSKFGEDLKRYEIGLFYFSGHGLQINGQNYLTAVDTGFFDETSAKHTSYPLDAVIEYMQMAEVDTKILILDACRDNPLPSTFRSTQQQGLAPIHAPKGTIIAFSTSPGEKAMDHGAGRNSIYTGSLLNHIDDANIPIEDFFKRVRTSVYHLSGGKQTSWEHTSLIGDFHFNSGELIHSVALPYRQDTVADHFFVSKGSAIDLVIENLKIPTWDNQNRAVESLKYMTPQSIDSSSQFLLGRSLLSSAIGGAYGSRGIFERLGAWLMKYQSPEGENHVLNGMLYEVYFNSKGLFRKADFKAELIDEIYVLQVDERYAKSFAFVKEQLLPFREHLFYLPSKPPQTLAIEAIIESQEVFFFGDKPEIRHRLRSIKQGNVELLHLDQSSRFGDRELQFQDFRRRLACALGAPLSHLRLSMNISEKEIRQIAVPYTLNLSREAPTPSTFSADF